MGRRAARWLIPLGVPAAAFAAYWYLTRPEPGTPRQQILRLIAEVERAIEQRRVSDVMKFVSEDYQDSRGYTRRDVQRLVVAGLRSRNVLDLSVQVTQISVRGDQASFMAEVDYCVGQPVSAGRAAHLTVQGHLRREGRHWRIVRGEGWQEAESAYF
ncbi:MAG: hypothetical protein AB7Y46_17430 [Armatimonadota bacterium]